LPLNLTGACCCSKGVAHMHAMGTIQGRLCASHDRHVLQGRIVLSSLTNHKDRQT
jgi:hypothetical protein